MSEGLVLEGMSFRHDRAVRHRRVLEAAKMLIYYGEHCSQDSAPCAHCTAWDELEAAVKDLSPVDSFVRVPEA